MKLYAKNTTVHVGKTQADIRKLIEKFGGLWIGVVTNHELTRPVDSLAFKLGGRAIRFDVQHPKENDSEITGYDIEKALTSEYSRRWREVWLIVKSRLIEAAQLRRDVSEVFMAQLVTKTGMTIWETAQNDMGALLSTGSLRDMLALSEGE